MRVLCVVLVLLLGLEADWAEAQGIVVVRHAEKAEDGTTDPALTSVGEARARALAESLSGSRVDALLATQYRRTKLTLEPLAGQHALEIEVVDAATHDNHVRTVAERASARLGEGLVVIAGHSNTVPGIIEALSGHIIEPLNEDDYDRIYLLIPGPGGMDVIRARYGAND